MTKYKKKWIVIFLFVFISLGLIILKNSCQDLGSADLSLSDGYKYVWLTDEKDMGGFAVCVPSNSHKNILRCERSTIVEYGGFEVYELYYFIDHKYLMAGIIFEPKAYYENLPAIRKMLEEKLGPAQFKSQRFWGWRKGGTLIEWYFLENLLHLGHEETIKKSNKESK